jgi:hypothetical protein
VEDEYWDKKKKRENGNIIICMIIVVGSITLSAYIRSVIPAIIGIVLSAVIYQRDK